MHLSRITIPFSTRVHTDHIRNFDVEYWIDAEMDMFMDGGLPHEPDINNIDIDTLFEDEVSANIHQKY